MLRMILVTLGFGVGTLWGIRSVVGAGVFMAWNDFFRPAPWARYHGYLYDFPSHHLCFAVMAFAVVFTTWKKRWTMASTALLVLLGWIWICTFRAEVKDVAHAKAIESSKYMVAPFIMSLALVARRPLQIYIYALASTVGIWMAHHGLLTLLRQAPEINMAIPAGQMTDRNDFLTAGSACLPLMIYSSWWYEGPWQRWVRLTGKVLCGLAAVVFFTALSRGAIVGMCALLLYWAVATGRIARRTAIAAVLLALAVTFMPNFVWDRLETIEVGGEQTERSAANRIAHMIAAVEVTLDYPLTGVGPSVFPHVARRYDAGAAEPHSIWLKCSAELGLPMLIFFLAITATMIGRLRAIAVAAKRRADRHTEALSVALSCAIVGFLATGTFTSQFLSEYLWSIIGTAGAFIGAERYRERQRQEAGHAEPVPEPAFSGAGGA